MNLKTFNKYAQIWCKNCGEGDSIKAKIKAERTYIQELDLEPELEGEEIVETIYYCENCGTETEDFEELVIESPSLAYNIWKIYNKMPKKGEWKE